MSYLTYFCFILICISFCFAVFEPVCPERCKEEDYFRSHPVDIMKSSKQLEKNPGVSKIRIAFVFAGTPRSLIFPPVHESIRENLIFSFCPKELCISDIFVRVSTSDNKHGGLDSVGILKKGDPSLRPKIEYAISRLNPQDRQAGESGLGVTEIDWTDIGSEKERSEMLSSPFSSQRHKVIRTLDPRRYSMYFNRWSAYQLAVRREAATGLQYTWVVHARLDAVWGEPVRAFRDWSPEYVCKFLLF